MLGFLTGDEKDRKIAVLEAENAALKAEVQRLSNRAEGDEDGFRPSAANGDRLLTKGEVVSMLTRQTGGGYAMSRDAAEAKWNEWAKENRNTEGLLSYRVVASGMTHLLFDLNYQGSSAASDGSVSPRSYGGASPRSAPRSAAAMVNTPRSGPLSPPRYRHVGASGFFDEPLARMSERSGSSADARMSRRRSEAM